MIDWKLRIVVAVVFFVGFIVVTSAVDEPTQLVSLTGGIIGGYILLHLYKRWNTS